VRAYLDLLQHVLENGKKREDRTGTGTLSMFGHSLRVNLQDGFPLLTTKKIHFKSVVIELLWMLKGDRTGNITYMLDNGVRIWKEWADVNNHLGPVYGAQWRHWQVHDPETINLYDESGEVVLTLPYSGYSVGYIDQLKETIENIKTNPFSRRHLISAWNPSDLAFMKLPPCHYAYQFYINEDKLDCMVQMRSVDLFLGLPFDIASYAIQLSMIAQLTGYKPGELIFNFGDTHIYLNHIEQVKEQLSREPWELPTLKLNNKITDIDDFKFEDIRLMFYSAQPAIKGEISV
jgi:thymidylate synthase